MPSASDPAPGSVIAIPPIFFPEARSGRYLAFWSWLPFEARLWQHSVLWARKDSAVAEQA